MIEDIRFEIRLNAESAETIRGSYDEIYSGERIRHLDSFYRWVLRQLDPVAGRTMLDVASGESVLGRMGRTHFGLHATSADLSLAALQTARQEGPDPLCVASGEALPFLEHSFDYVTCIGSLEHFFDMRAGIREMARVLKPSGTACILVPNTYGLLNNVYKAFKTGFSTIDTQPLQRYAARNEWAWLFEQNGLRVRHTVKYEREMPDTLADARWYAQHPREAVKLALTPVIPINLATCLVYLCEPEKSV